MRNKSSQKLLIISYMLLIVLIDQAQKNFVLGKELKKNTFESSGSKQHNSDSEDEYPKFHNANAPGIPKGLTESQGSSSNDSSSDNSSSDSSSSDSSSSDRSSSDDSSSDDSSSSSEDESYDGDVTPSSLNIGEEPSTSTGIGRKRRRLYLQKSTKKMKKQKKVKVLSKRKKLQLKRFMMENKITLLLAEIEVRLFGSKSLVLSNYWLDKNKLNSEKGFVSALIGVLTQEESYLVEDVNMEPIIFYLENVRKLKSNLVPGYDSSKKSIFQQMEIFKSNFKKIKCNNIKISFIIFYLIFEFNEYFIFNGFLLFILLCSFNELEDIEFVLYSTHRKISKYKVPHKFQFFNVEEFGLGLCLVLLELHILSESRLNDLQIFLFFGSRFSSSSSVLLAYDIYKLAKQNTSTSTDVVASILFDDETFNKVQRRVLEMHNLDLKNFKKHLNQCFQAKEGYDELLGIRRNTDIQEKSLRKSTGQEQIKLNLKYPFLN
ncbi:uncharacterized protein ELE39_003472 [Cryptosporidium sp. chipmunk genotype I]|uniref:uncharacterized protein n=1 Tax=Cryptosporidium sp. chipmunk genotype I TaxID=1280935 RepID=UPI00351AA7E9|nr:hypothetical protein ELE39_003472 [Cryptosporidium sp. chipmunk genotype I]